jgi:hypothetical protein
MFKVNHFNIILMSIVGAVRQVKLTLWNLNRQWCESFGSVLHPQRWWQRRFYKYLLVQWRKGVFGTAYNVPLADLTRTSYKYTHVSLTVQCIGFLICCDCIFSLLGTAIKLHSTKSVCDNSDETKLYHDSLVAAARYCQPMGYYNRWHS